MPADAGIKDKNYLKMALVLLNMNLGVFFDD